MTAKKALRAALIARRDALPADVRRQAGREIVRRVRALPAWGRARTVLAYQAFGSELDLDELQQELLRRGGRLVAPRVPAVGRILELRQVREPRSDLRPGRWGIPEPDPARCPEVEPGAIDLVLVPGVGFDVAGNRLGYGAGFYDRLFERLPVSALRLACAFDAMVCTAIPCEPHDQRIDLLVTEMRTVACAALPPA